MLAGLLKSVPGGRRPDALSGGRLAVGLIGNFVLGALMTLGIGAFAPCMILVGLLGMNVKATFPIMMGSCAFLMPAAGPAFVRLGRYAPRPALGLTLGGVPGVLLAAFVVRELPLATLRWLVLAVVVYTALAMLRTGLSPSGGTLGRHRQEPPRQSALSSAKVGFDGQSAVRDQIGRSAPRRRRALPRPQAHADGDWTWCCWASAPSSAPASSC